MTVMRLASGDLLLHSPTKYSAALHAALESLGSIRYLLAPNTAHWMFIHGWQRHLRQATTLAVPGLAARRQVRKAGLRIDREVRDAPPQEWIDEIQTVLVSGLFFAEIAVFHKPTGTLVLTDLVLNIRPETLSFVPRIFARLVGSTAPDGKAPFYLRLLLRRGGVAAKLAAGRLIRFAPARVVFAHGEWYRDNATQRLRRALRWLAEA